MRDTTTGNHREAGRGRENQPPDPVFLPMVSICGLPRGHADETLKGTGGQAEPLKFRLWGWGAGQGTEGIW